MGERVVIRDEPRLASEAPPEDVPLGYGRANRAGNAWRWIDSRLHAFGDAMKELVSGIIVPALGGWRQVGFAVGLSFVLGGLGAALDRNGEAGFLMWLGGLLIGLTVRVTGSSERNRGSDR